MKLLYLTACRAYAGKLREVNNTYRAAYVGQHPGVTLGGPGFDAPVGEPLALPEYVRRVAPDTDAVFVSDPWHNFWDPCPDYPNCPPLYSGIDDLDLPVVIESGDSQFYYAETLRHLAANPRSAVCIRALSHRWRFCAPFGCEDDDDGWTNGQLDEIAAMGVDLRPGVPWLLGPGALGERPIFYLPHGAYPEMVVVSRGEAKAVDVLFSGSDIPESYPARARLATALRSEAAKGLTVDWLPHPSDAPPGVVGPAFWRRVARARIAVAGTNAYRNLTMRYLEIPACGTLAIGDVPWPESERESWASQMLDIGDADPDGIVRMIREVLADPEALARRTAAAREFVLSRHSFAAEWRRVVGEIEAWIADGCVPDQLGSVP